IVGGAYATHYNTSRELRKQTDTFLTTRALRLQRVGRAIEDRPFSQQPAGGVLANGTFEGTVGLDSVTQILRPDGTVVSRLNSQPALPVDAQDVAIARGQDRTRLRDATVDGVHYRLLTAPLADGGAVQVARSEAETDAVLAVLRLRLLLIALIGSALATGIAWWVARRATAPIKRLTEASERIASTQDLAMPIDVSGRDEVARLGASFNTMLVALDTSREQQNRLVVDASHELRTPLTAVRTNVEFLRRAGDTLDPEERGKLLAETSVELDELSNLVVELVELATAERSEEPVDRVDLVEVANDVADRYRRRTGRAITVAAPDSAMAEGRRSMLDRALSNLVDNALKFSPPSQPVEIVVTPQGVEVADRGFGIDPDDQERVFDRFYRSTASRSLPGSGLGLAIVKRIVDLHGGTVSVLPRPQGGTVARIEVSAGTDRNGRLRPPASRH
ncbi:MAG: HAMP domain-containing histidine kinase, partial [Actinobacteria bacterium]|nr:HAMP domain-containing histidine kinase [Actinomycetota bacterium]